MKERFIKMFDYRDEYLRIEDEVLCATKRVLRSGELILSSEVEEFEKNFAALFESNSYGVGVSNGTDALKVSLMAIGVRPGDEVITVANTAVPTVSAILALNAKPVFADVDYQTALMDLNKIEKLITKKTKAIVPVHLYGNAVDMPRLLTIANHYAIPVVEDCAQATGTTLGGKAIGTFGCAAAFSFYPTKNLGAYGDAGFCLTGDAEILARMRKIRNYGFREKSYADCRGINARLDEIQAAVLNVKLKYLKDQLNKRKVLASLYLEGLDQAVIPLLPTLGVDHSYHLFVVRTPNRDRLREKLLELGIQTGVHYPYPINKMPGLQIAHDLSEELPVTEKLCREIVSLPLYPDLSRCKVLRVIEAINKLVV
jgi:dTDP-4-amino-4,6-dideoxygalactose transaminase